MKQVTLIELLSKAPILKYLRLLYIFVYNTKAGRPRYCNPRFFVVLTYIIVYSSRSVTSVSSPPLTRMYSLSDNLIRWPLSLLLPICHHTAWYQSLRFGCSPWFPADKHFAVPSIPAVHQATRALVAACHILCWFVLSLPRLRCRRSKSFQCVCRFAPVSVPVFFSFCCLFPALWFPLHIHLNFLQTLILYSQAQLYIELMFYAVWFGYGMRVSVEATTVVQSVCAAQTTFGCSFYTMLFFGSDARILRRVITLSVHIGSKPSHIGFGFSHDRSHALSTWVLSNWTLLNISLEVMSSWLFFTKHCGSCPVFLICLLFNTSGIKVFYKRMTPVYFSFASISSMTVWFHFLFPLIVDIPLLSNTFVICFVL